MKEDITVRTDSAVAIKRLIEWLETKAKHISVTIVMQSIGDITNSHVENVNIQ